MTQKRSTFVWPSAPILVLRAERELKVAPHAHQSIESAARFAELETWLFRYEQGYGALVPPGFESAGRLAAAKRFAKKVTRRFVWWYVEPRWTVHREMTGNLAGFGHTSMDMLRSMSTELDLLRLRVAELEDQASRAHGIAAHDSAINVFDVGPETESNDSI